MSDVQVQETESPTSQAGLAAPDPQQPLFEKDELARFDLEDSQAGGNIGRMLAFFFFYTVLAMSGVACWTYNAIAD